MVERYCLPAMHSQVITAFQVLRSFASLYIAVFLLFDALCCRCHTSGPRFLLRPFADHLVLDITSCNVSHPQMCSLDALKTLTEHRKMRCRTLRPPHSVSTLSNQWPDTLSEPGALMH